MRRGSIQRILELVRKELRQIFREPRMRAVLLVAPVIQLLMFGYAVSTDVRNTRLFVVDQDRTALSRDLAATLTASGYFQLAGASQDVSDLVSSLDHGDSIAALAIPPGFSRSFARGDASVQLIVDGSNSNVATIALGHAERIATSWTLRAAGATATPAFELRERAWFNPDLESRNYNVPGVTGMIIFLICLLLTALAIVREREMGTLEQLMVSPVRPWELIAGKSIPFALIGIFDLALVTVIGMFWFDIPFRGSFTLLTFASILFILSALGIGLLISTVSSTQQEAFMGTFLVFLPSILLAGFMFPVRSMPELFQWLTLANPLRHYLVIVRSIFLKGSGLVALWPQFLALLLIGGSIFAFAVSRFEKRIG